MRPMVVRVALSGVSVVSAGDICKSIHDLNHKFNVVPSVKIANDNVGFIVYL